MAHLVVFHSPRTQRLEEGCEGPKDGVHEGSESCLQAFDSIKHGFTIKHGNVRGRMRHREAARRGGGESGGGKGKRGRGRGEREREGDKAEEEEKERETDKERERVTDRQ